jgi:hypothetical protein
LEQSLASARSGRLLALERLHGLLEMGVLNSGARTAKRPVVACGGALFLLLAASVIATSPGGAARKRFPQYSKLLRLIVKRRDAIRPIAPAELFRSVLAAPPMAPRRQQHPG